MKKFQSNVNRELGNSSYPDRRRLETQCLSVLTFVKSENDLLDCPIWILIVNVVAMDMLKCKMPPGNKYLLKIFLLLSFYHLITIIFIFQKIELVVEPQIFLPPHPLTKTP